MMGEQIREALNEAAERGTEIHGGTPLYSIRVTFKQLLFLMKKNDEFCASQARAD